MRHPNAVKPVIAAHLRRRTETVCSRGHEITGYNARPVGNLPDSKTCRACHATNQWARTNNLFRDDPLVIEHADRLIEQYRARAVTQ